MAHPRGPSTPPWLLSLGSPNGLGQAYLFASELAAPVALDRSTPASGVIRGHTGGDLHQCAQRWRSTCFVVHDKTSQPLAYIHFEDKSGRLSPINQLTRDDALRIAENIAKLPELLGKA